MPASHPPVTSEQLDAWLMSLPMRDRKLKQQRIIDRLRVSKRTVENWRGGRTIPAKHFPELHEIMKGADKISIDFDPEVFDALSRKAQERGYKDVPDYLAALSRLILCGAILLGSAHHLAPTAGQGITPAAATLGTHRPG